MSTASAVPRTPSSTRGDERDGARRSEGRDEDPATTDKNGKAVLFGGTQYGNALGDTWLWDGTNWTQGSTSVAPDARWFPAMGTDRNGNVILFGGAHYYWNNLVSPETWKWDGASWSNVTGTTSPPAKENGSMALDKNGNLVMYGGGDGYAPTGETWLWDGSAWHQANPAHSPTPARMEGRLARDKKSPSPMEPVDDDRQFRQRHSFRRRTQRSPG